MNVYFFSKTPCALFADGARLGTADGFARRTQLSPADGVFCECKAAGRVPFCFFFDEDFLFAPPEGAELYFYRGDVAVCVQELPYSDPAARTVWRKTFGALTLTLRVQGRVLLDMAGAERLLGKGDMLIKFVDKNHPVRVQGAFVDMREVAAVVDEVVANNVGIFDPEIAKVIDAVPAEEEERVPSSASGGAGGSTSLEQDPAFIGALRLALENKAIGRGISVSMLQRKLSLGFPKAAKILDQMEELGYVSGMAQGNKPRDVYLTQEMFDELYGDSDGGGDE